MNTQEHADRKHAKRSPSSLGNYAVCPHFQKDDNQPVHPITLEGTKVHEAIERESVEGLTEDQAKMAHFGMDYLKALQESGDFTTYSEIRLVIPHMDFGHADAVLISSDGKTGHLIDFKAGYRHQAAAANNAQQKAYATAVFAKFHTLETLTVHIVYVRLQEIDKVVFDKAYMELVELELIAIDRKAQAASEGKVQAHNPDPAVCGYCAAAGICPALQLLAIPIAEEYAQARPGDLTIPDKYDPALISDPAVMSRALVVADIMERWSGSVKKHAIQMRLNGGEEIPGYNLAHRAGSVEVIDQNTIYQKAVEKGLTHEQIMATVKVSVPQLSELISNKAERGNKKLAKQKFEEELRDAGAIRRGEEVFFLKKSRS